MTVVIGVTGHRFLTELERVKAGIDEALHEIAAHFEGPPFTIISSLAEGADRLVVQRAFERWEVSLSVPLPLPAQEYMADFQTPASRESFLTLLEKADEVLTLPTAGTRSQSYAAAGHYVVAHCDVLLTVWDGRAAQGTGGTGEIVSRARERNLPLAWIHAGNRRPGTLQPTTLGDEQGQVTLERFGRG